MDSMFVRQRRGNTLPTLWLGLTTLAIAAAAHAQTVTFEPPRISPWGTAPFVLAVGDLNADGRSDFIIVNGAQGAANQILLGQADGTFASGGLAFNDPQPHTGLVADVNGDGRLDAIASERAGAATLLVRLGNSSGGLDPQIVSPLPAAIGPMASGDFNRDGRTDLAGPSFAIFGNGDGTFGASQTYAAGGLGVAAADLNHDGATDVAVSFFSQQSIGVFLSNGDGTFQAGVGYPAGGEAATVNAADLDADGHRDLVSSFRNGVSVLLGTGTGTFGPPQTFAVNSTGNVSTLADFNGDGRIDVAVPAVLLGDGAGHFGAPVPFPTAVNRVTAGDFNGDGRPDLVGANGAEEGEYSAILNSTGVSGARTGIAWTNLTNASASFNTLSRSGGCTDACFDASGFSVQTIQSSTDAIVSFRFHQFPGLSRVAGLTHLGSGTSPAIVDFGFALAVGGAGLTVQEQGVVKATLNWGTYTDLTIVVDDGMVSYYAGGSLVYTSTAAPVYPLRLAGVFGGSAARVDNAWIQIVGQSGGGGEDPIVWTNAANVTTSANALVKNGGCDGCFDAGASAEQAIDETGGFVEFTVDSVTAVLEVGLATSAAARQPSEIEFGLLLQGGGWVEVRESGAYRTDTAVQAGDLLRIALADGVITYALNGAVFHTSASPVVPPLFAVFSLVSQQASVSGVVVSGDGSGGGSGAAWTDVVNAVANGSSLQKNAGCDGCFDAGGTASKQVAQNGFVQLTVADAAKTLEVGLASSATDRAPGEIEFGLLVQGGGWIEVREAGEYRTDTRIQSGDVVRIALVNGVVTYSVNGVVFYSSAGEPAPPLFAVVSLSSMGAAVTNVVIGGS